jgi:hypothetical protein
VAGFVDFRQQSEALQQNVGVAAAKAQSFDELVEAFLVEAAKSYATNSQYNFWVGLFVPSRTPGEIVARLHDAAELVLKSPELRAKLVALGADPFMMTQPEFDAYIRPNTPRWANGPRLQASAFNERSTSSASAASASLAPPIRFGGP